MQALEHDPLWDRVEEYRRKKGPRGRLASVKMVRSYPHDLLIDLRSSAMPLFSGARYRPFWGLRELLLPKKMHEAERNIWCMTTLGVPVFSRKLRFFLPQGAREEACRVLGAIENDLPWVLLNPGAGGRDKVWPSDNFAELGRRLLGTLDVNVGITGYSPVERETAAGICGALGSKRCVDLSGAHHITRLGALVERSLLFVSSDTGPLHVASAVGTPVVGLYLPRNLARFGPWGNRHKCLVAEINDGVEPMRTIGVEGVFRACKEMLSSLTLQKKGDSLSM